MQNSHEVKGVNAKKREKEKKEKELKSKTGPFGFLIHTRDEKMSNNGEEIISFSAFRAKLAHLPRINRFAQRFRSKAEMANRDHFYSCWSCAHDHGHWE